MRTTKKTHRFKLKKLLPAGMAFPFDFWIYEGTKGEDDAPLDMIIIAEFDNFSGSVLDCRIIGAFKAEQKDDDGLIRNDRFIAIPVVSVLYERSTLSINCLQHCWNSWKNSLSIIIRPKEKNLRSCKK